MGGSGQEYHQWLCTLHHECPGMGLSPLVCSTALQTLKPIGSPTEQTPYQISPCRVLEHFLSFLLPQPSVAGVDCCE